MSVAKVSSPPAWSITFDRPAQIKAAIVGAAFIAVFWRLLDFIPGAGLGEVVYRWVHESDWSHGPIIPLFSAYLLHLRWDQIKRAPIRHTWVGLVVMIPALALYQASLWGLLPFGYARPLAMMLCLLGVVVFLCGLPVLRYAWLPWLFLFFAIPIPHRYYFLLTDPLQRLAASATCAALELLPALEIERLGTMIHATYRGQVHSLSVSDACSGMRSTMVLCALGTAVAFVAWRPWWQRLILVASCIPIATFCNFVRVTTTSGLHIFVDPKYASGTYHTALGLLVILLATGMFLGLAWILNNLFLEEAAGQTPGEEA
jgi:exosortase